MAGRAVRPVTLSFPARGHAPCRGLHLLTRPQMNTIRAGFTLHRCTVGMSIYKPVQPVHLYMNEPVEPVHSYINEPVPFIYE